MRVSPYSSQANGFIEGDPRKLRALNEEAANEHRYPIMKTVRPGRYDPDDVVPDFRPAHPIPAQKAQSAEMLKELATRFGPDPGAQRLEVAGQWAELCRGPNKFISHDAWLRDWLTTYWRGSLRKRNLRPVLLPGHWPRS